MAQKKKAKPAKSKTSKKALKKALPVVKPIAKKYAYDFGNKTDGDATQRSLLGGKGANLAEMAKIGLPVPRVLPSLPKFAPISMRTSSPTLRFWRSK